MARRAQTAQAQTCRRCGRAGHRPGARFCGACGARLSDSSDPRSPDSPHNEFMGLLLVLVGLMLIFWVTRHSPYTNSLTMLATTVTDPHAYFIQEPQYSIIVLAAAGSVIWGVIRIVRGLIGARKS